MDEARKDFLTEMLNIGVGRAGSVVSELVGTRVSLDVPEVSVCSTDDVGGSLQTFANENLVTVTCGFKGILCGDATLIMTRFSANMITHRLMEQMGGAGDVEELRDEAMSEVGNIVLHSLIGAWSGVFADSFDIGLPDCRRGTVDDYVSQLQSSAAAKSGQKTYAVSASAHFNVDDFFIMGTLLVLFDERSIGMLMGAAEEAPAE